MLIASKAIMVSPFPKATHYVLDNHSSFSMNDLETEKLLPCPTLWDAISDLPEIEACEGSEVMDYTKPVVNDYQKYCRNGSSKVYNHLAMKHTKRLVERFSQLSWGQSVSDIVDDKLKQRKRNGNGAVSEKPPVRGYLAADWGGKIADGLQRGYLI